MKPIEFLKDYFNENEYFIIAQKHPIKNGKIKHNHTITLLNDPYLSLKLNKYKNLNKNENVDIYFTLNEYNKQSLNSRFVSRKETKVKSIKSFYFDIDKGDIEKKKSDIIHMFGLPTYIIESSLNKFQFIYKFKEPKQVKSFDDIIHFKKLLKGLLYHFDVDKTFDTARIFRLVGYMNKKNGNNDFVVNIKKNDALYSFEDFEKISSQYVLNDDVSKPTKKNTNINKTTTKKSKPLKNHSFDKYKDISKKFVRKYRDLSIKYNDDLSVVDLSYARWLYFQRKITDDETIIKKIFEARGYESIIDKHNYQLDYYFHNILTNCKKEL